MVYQPMVTLSTCTMRAGRFFGRGMFGRRLHIHFPPSPTRGGAQVFLCFSIQFDIHTDIFYLCVPWICIPNKSQMHTLIYALYSCMITTRGIHTYVRPTCQIYIHTDICVFGTCTKHMLHVYTWDRCFPHTYEIHYCALKYKLLIQYRVPNIIFLSRLLPCHCQILCHGCIGFFETCPWCLRDIEGVGQ